MSTIWENLRVQGDWVFVEDKTPGEISSLVNNFLKRNYSRDCLYTCRQIPGGTFVALAFIPEGALEAYDERKSQIRQERSDRLVSMREERTADKKHIPHLTKQAKADRSGTYGDDTSDPMAELDEEYGDDD